MKIAIFQYDPDWENRDANMQKIWNMAADLDNGIDLMVFPELTLTAFTMRSRRFAEGLADRSIGFFSDLARTYHAGVFAGLIENKDNNFYNSMVHINPSGHLMAVYRKIHPFSFSGENRFYRGGMEPVVTMVGEVHIGMTICYDLRFPELYRKYGKARTELIINIANWPEKRIVHWQALLRARAIENQAYVIGVNRVGSDKKNTYNGCSAIYHPYGDEILLAENRQGVFVSDLDVNEVYRLRKMYPFLDDIILV